ncbi:arylsulfatase [Lutimonas saemankumensis]|uniref:sulfatase family protein n=1 Tax=Lutimonas saemankumensis TaxID=483016 RepID=UPI001CD22E92|nr:arylsulfatase [Lutimonas saemankumensis]MCA0932465.1 arylsulfatase [Lutimonas saemankumensis]
MKIRIAAVLFVTGILLSFTTSCQKKKQSSITDEKPISKPNIVIIYTDDLGYGDISANGATEINTPNIDLLANEGVRFTNGYASSATCTPSRYALLTGVYPWKNERAKILPGTAPLIIGTDQMTIPRMLKGAGYHTGIVGKWHLGLGNGNVNWNETVKPGPNELGFDYSHIMAATQDRVPTVYIQDGDVVGLDPKDPIEVDYKNNFEGQPTGKDNPELLEMKWHHGHNSSIVNGIPRIGYMKGGETAKWSDIDMADHFLKEAQNYVRAHKEEPFFLYYAMQQPHVPRTPHPRFAGKSGMGPRGDVILEADWMVGEFLQTLREEGLLENTLIVFTSDNGPVLNDGYYDDAVEKLGMHTPAGPFRGGKYSLYEAGTHVPFITYWKGRIQPGISDALVCQIDLLSSIAKLVDSDVRAEDSKELADVFLGQSEEGREDLILEATTRTAYRNGDWVLIPPYKGTPVNKLVNIETGNSKKYQLFDLSKDLGQETNLASSRPDKLKEMIEMYESKRGDVNRKTEQLELK